MKSILITGAANGIGKSIAEHCGKAGYRVGLLDLDENQLNDTAGSIENAVVLKADVTRPEDVKAAMDEFGTPDTVVNNAGIVRFGPLIEQSIEDFTTTVNINLIGTYIVAREAAHRMKAAGSGHIINMSSINSVTPGPGAGAYPATKAGVAQMARQLAIELGDHNIRVNAIAPGFIDAGMSAPIYEDEKVRNQRAGAVPSGRLGTAEDIANAVLYLDSDNGNYINGHELIIDGGVVHSLLAQLPRD
ncbi:MAG: SDR family oxidoreductase [Pseudomonadales bacterium]|nr:SDR family oxidoreductase [Pseudomonadales bacterium]